MMPAEVQLEDILEAALLAAGEPLSLERLEVLFEAAECPPRRELRQALEQLQTRHDAGALELLETASGYQLRIRPRLSPWVSRLWDERPQRYSRALLETLALIAYRQPVTRGDIEEVRGVSVSSSIMRTLMEREWIRVVGHRDVPGRPAVYATTRTFLDEFGLKTLDALPPIHTLLGDALPEQEQGAFLTPGADAQPGSDSQADTQSGKQATETTSKEITSTETQSIPPTAETADTQHAETASNPPLSFAELEARLAARAVAPHVDDDASAHADNLETRSNDHEQDT
ncbi:SMC-Scp complex subunit ScpB [Halomonas sp. Bachu 37]|uniref:SMC-Scp complex subunit ScpB n=1 Tax=Halomonas kashgarensis TaxID=3084920 RepID=UPI003217CDED